MIDVGASIVDRLAELSRNQPDRPFIRYRDGAPISYGAMRKRVSSLAAGLADLGVTAGDTVLVCMPNSIELVETWLACSVLGAIEVPVNTHLRGEFLSHVLNDSLARIAVVHAAFIPYLEQIGNSGNLEKIVVVGESTPFGGALRHCERISYASVSVDRDIAFTRPASTDVMAIFYTSGTTGPAKGVMSTFGHVNVAAKAYLRAIGGRPDDVFFCCMPLFHANAQILQVAACLIIGGSISVWEEFHASKWLDQIRSVGATITNSLGVMAEFIYRQPVRSDDSDNPLRIVQTVPAPEEIAADFEKRFGVICVDGYGMTDAGMVAFRNHDEPLVPGSSGRPIAEYEVVIADPETDIPLPAGEVGQILLRPRVPGGFSRGYWRRPEATVDAWQGLWFHTGDAGVLDENGLLYFRDRISDSIRVRGENISSLEIERVVSSHPSVQQCAAVGLKSDIGDQEIIVFLLLKDGANFSPEDLLSSCTGRMPYFAVPRYIEVVDELPMTNTQKVKKAELRSRGVQASTWDRVAAGYIVQKT